jgi:hypothetical protein
MKSQKIIKERPKNFQLFGKISSCAAVFLDIHTYTNKP